MLSLPELPYFVRKKSNKNSFQQKFWDIRKQDHSLFAYCSYVHFNFSMRSITSFLNTVFPKGFYKLPKSHCLSILWEHCLWDDTPLPSGHRWYPAAAAALPKSSAAIPCPAGYCAPLRHTLRPVHFCWAPDRKESVRKSQGSAQILLLRTAPYLHFLHALHDIFLYLLNIIYALSKHVNHCHCWVTYNHWGDDMKAIYQSEYLQLGLKIAY